MARGQKARGSIGADSAVNRRSANRTRSLWGSGARAELRGAAAARGPSRPPSPLRRARPAPGGRRQSQGTARRRCCWCCRPAGIRTAKRQWWRGRSWARTRTGVWGVGCSLAVRTCSALPSRRVERQQRAVQTVPLPRQCRRRSGIDPPIGPPRKGGARAPPPAPPLPSPPAGGGGCAGPRSGLRMCALPQPARPAPACPHARGRSRLRDSTSPSSRNSSSKLGSRT